MKVILCTNIPAPYSVDFYNELGKYCDLTVVYERYTSSERNAAWKGDKAFNFKEVYLKLKPVGVEHAKGSGLRKYIKENHSDALIFANYASPASLEAIIWCRLHKRKYIINWDGGFFKRESYFKKVFKKFILGGAEKHFISCEELRKYLLSMGIPQNRIFMYPFTSIRENDIAKNSSHTRDEKKSIRKKLGIEEEKVVLSVGRFSYEKGYGKGYDVLLKAASHCDSSIGFYIVGDEPTEEFVLMKQNLNLQNVHYVGFKTKEELAEYYIAADLSILLSRGDVWGLVINEAMSFALPIISSDKCIAGLELVKEGENGYVVGLADEKYIAEKIQVILEDSNTCSRMGQNSLGIIKDYTIEKMAKRQLELLELI